MAFPSPATAVSRAVYALSGKAGLYNYIFDLLILPNIVKILSLAHYDSMGGNVIQQFHACYSHRCWWPDARTHEYNSVSCMVWIIWKLFSGAVHYDSLQLSTLTTKEFFTDGPPFDYSSMPDQRLQFIITTLSRYIRKSCQLLMHLPLDAKGCESFDTDAVVSTANLKTALPHLTEDFDRRLGSLLQKPKEIVETLVLSRFELSTLFDAISASASSCNGKDKEYENKRSLLNEEIESYYLLEGIIQKNVSPHDQPVSEQIILKLLPGPGPGTGTGPLGSTVPLSPDKDVAHSHRLLWRGLLLAKTYETTLQTTLTNIQHNRPNKLEDLLDEEFKQINYCLSPTSKVNSPGGKFFENSGRNHVQGPTLEEHAHSHTQTSALKLSQPHRGVISVIRAMDRATQEKFEGIIPPRFYFSVFICVFVTYVACVYL